MGGVRKVIVSSRKKFHASGPGVSKANEPRDPKRFGRAEKKTKSLGNDKILDRILLDVLLCVKVI